MDTRTAKVLLGVAKTQIKAHQWNEALDTLQKIDHPTAREWEAHVQDKLKRQPALWKRVLLVVLSLFLTGFGLWYWADTNARYARFEARQECVSRQMTQTAEFPGIEFQLEGC